MCLKELVIANSHTANGRRPDHAVVIIYITILRKRFLDGLDNILLCDRSAHYLQYPFAFYKSKSICLDGSVMYDYCESFFFFFFFQWKRTEIDIKNIRKLKIQELHIHTYTMYIRVFVCFVYTNYMHICMHQAAIYIFVYMYTKKKSSVRVFFIFLNIHLE